MGRRTQPPAGGPDAIGWRDAAYSLLAIADADPASRAACDHLLDAVDPWSTGLACTNFSGVEDTTFDAVRRSLSCRGLRPAAPPQSRGRPSQHVPHQFQHPPNGDQQ